MGPESYNQYSNLRGTDNGFRRKLIALIALAVIMLIGIIVFQTQRTTTIKVGNKTYSYKGSPTLGTMKLVASGIADGTGLTISLNSSPFTAKSFISSGSFSKSLPAGSYTIQATEPGFKSFSTQFTINWDRSTIIEVSLPPNTDTTITSWSQVQSKGDPAQWDTPAQYITNPNPTITITNVVYFYNKTWALITTYDGSQYGYEMAKYDPQKSVWIGVAETTQFFSNDNVYSMPSEVQTYLENNNYSYIGQQ